MDHSRCSNCRKGRPIFFWQEEGETKSLCKACGKTLGVDAGSIDGICRGFATKTSTDSTVATSQNVDLPVVCPNCGTRLDDVISHRLVGCEKCFETFEDVIKMLLPEWQGLLDDPADKMHRDLHDALRRQQYERAAQLRDILNGAH